MAITQDYVDWATGNDYKGATFTDGAWTAATHTLTKAGAFAATKVNHWLYLEPNGGVSFTAGYFRVATVPDANSVTLASDLAVGNLSDVKCTQHDGSTSLPWRSDQGAVDLCTRNSTDGNQVNISDAAAVVHAAALDLATFIGGGALAAAPLILRGYTSSANDGGIGEIDCGGATMFAATTYMYITLADLEIHTFGDTNGVVLAERSIMYHCEVHKGTSSPTAKALVIVGTFSEVLGCYVHDIGANGANGIVGASRSLIYGNYVDTGTETNGDAEGIVGTSPCSIVQNIVKCGANIGAAIFGGQYSNLIGNMAYSTVANTGIGIYAYSDDNDIMLNNIAVGFSGAGGKGLAFMKNAGLVGYNAYYNCTTGVSVPDQKYIDLTANDVALGADPFTDAANGDFSLTAAAKTALASKGFPISYLGAHANTVPNLNIGPIQMAASTGGGGMLKAEKRGGKQ